MQSVVHYLWVILTNQRALAAPLSATLEESGVVPITARTQ